MDSYIYGREVKEWATWTESLNTDILGYYDFDETTGTVLIDVTGNGNNGTNSNAIVNQSGILGKAYDFVSASPSFILFDTPLLDTISAFSISFWVNIDTIGQNQMLVSNGANTAGFYMYYGGCGANTMYVNFGAQGLSPHPSALGITQATWTHMVSTYDGADTYRLYIDGVGSYNNTAVTGELNATRNFTIGTWPEGSLYSDALFDEVGIWERELSVSEVQDLYNGGTGITYVGTFPSPPNITLNSPTVDANYTTVQNLIINFTVYDNINLSDVKLYINGALNQTNASGINDSNYLFNVGLYDGDYTINGVATDNQSETANSSSVRFVIDTTDPTINIITPVNDTTTTTIPINVSLNATVTDLNLDTCWYYTTDNSTNITYTCNTLTNVTFSTGGDKTIYVFANDTLGHEAGEETSFLINYVQENAVYNSTVVEGETTTLILNVTASEITTFNGTIRYNGTDYTPTLTNDSTEALLTYTLTAPVVSANTLVYFNWSYTLNGVAYNSSEHNHTIIYLTPLVISTSCDDKAIRFDIVDEENLTALYGEIDYNFKYGLSNGTLKSVYGNISNATTFYACINATVSQNYTIGYGEIQYSNSDHVDRRYYLFEGRKVNNNTIANISLRDLLTIDQTSFLLTMEDTSLNVYAEKYTALWRWYPDLNEYQIVEMGKTDEDGHTVAHVNTEDVDYRIGLYELDGTLIKLGEPLRFICTSAPCSFTLRVGAGEIDYSSIFDIQAEITYNQTSKVFTLIYNDPNSYTSLMRFLVTRESGTNSLIICNDTNAGFTGVMSCNTSEYTGLKKAVAYRSASPPVIIVQKVVSEINTTFNSGFGLFIAVILWLAIVLSGFGNNPIWIIVLGVVGLIPALFFGTINIAIFTGIAVLGAIIIHFIKMAVAR